MKLLTPTPHLAALLLALAGSATAAAPTSPTIVTGSCRFHDPDDSRPLDVTRPVVLGYRLSAAGELQQVSVLESSGDAPTDAAAATALRQCRFAPAQDGGAAVDGDARVSVPMPRRPDGPGVRPDLSKCGRPNYPKDAAQAGAQGTTRVAFEVGPDRRVQFVELLASAGTASLDRAAIQAIAVCQFRPRIDESGRPSTTRAEVDYVWKLD